jgi:hypothetical protein
MNRERLPNRRAAETFEVEVNGLHYTATVGRFADGRIGEIFVQNSKPGSTNDCYMRDAITRSMFKIVDGQLRENKPD